MVEAEQRKTKVIEVRTLVGSYFGMLSLRCCSLHGTEQIEYILSTSRWLFVRKQHLETCAHFFLLLRHLCPTTVVVNHCFSVVFVELEMLFNYVLLRRTLISTYSNKHARIII